MFGTSKQFTTRYIQLSNGCDVAYIDEGSGDKTILFVHGLATYSYSWAANINELKEHYRCIAIDLPGNGYSQGGDYTYGINFFSGCVYDFMLQLKLNNVILAGHSMGGQIILNLVANHPTACKQLVLCAPAGFEKFSTLERSLFMSGAHLFDFFASEEYSLTQTIKASFHHYPKKVEAMIQELIKLMKEQPMSQYRSMIKACIHGMMNEPVFDDLHTIQQPALVMYGTKDALIPNKLIHHTTTESIAQKGTAEMPHATLHMLPDCGHFLQLEQPETVNNYIREFLG